MNFGIQPKSGYVDIPKSDLLEKVGVTAVEIVSLSQAVQRSFPLPFYFITATILDFRQKYTSDFYGDRTIERPVPEKCEGRHRIHVFSRSEGEVRWGG